MWNRTLTNLMQDCLNSAQVHAVEAVLHIDSTVPGAMPRGGPVRALTTPTESFDPCAVIADFGERVQDALVKYVIAHLTKAQRRELIASAQLAFDLHMLREEKTVLSLREECHDQVRDRLREWEICEPLKPHLSPFGKAIATELWTRKRNKEERAA